MSTSVSADTALLRSRFDAIPLLARLPAPVVEKLWLRCHPKPASAGERIVEQGTRADRLVLLLVGSALSVTDTPGGRSVVLATWSAPAALDKVATFGGGTHPGSIVAGERAWWCTLAKSVIDQVLDDHPQVRRHVLARVAQAAESARTSFVDAATRTSVARLASWLLAAGANDVVVPRPQDELAHQLGMTRVTLNRALHQLARNRVIDLRGQVATIRSADRLRAVADQG